MTPKLIMATNFRPFATSFTMPMSGHEQPYVIPTSMMESLHTNPSTFADNAANAYSQYWHLDRP